MMTATPTVQSSPLGTSPATNAIQSPSLVAGRSTPGGSTATPTPSSSARSSDQLYEVLALALEVLPSLPRTGVFSVQVSTASSGSSSGSSSSSSSRPAFVRALSSLRRGGSATSDSSEADSTAKEDEAREARVAFLSSHPEILTDFCTLVLPKVIQEYSLTINGRVKYKCVSLIVKLIVFSPSDLLRSVLRDLAISSFIAALLCTNDLALIVSGLQIASVALEKLPDVFGVYFYREGVAHEITRLATAEALSPSSAAATAAVAEPDTPSATTPGSAPSTPTPHGGMRGRMNELFRDFRRRRPLTPTQQALDSTTGSSTTIPSSSSSSSLIAGPDEDRVLADWILAESRRISSSLQALRDAEQVSDGSSVSAALTQAAAAVASGKWTTAGELRNALMRVHQLFTDDKMGVSAFELHSSGLAAALSGVLGGQHEKAGVAWETQLRIFVSVFFGVGGSAEDQSGEAALPNDNTAAVLLVRRLNETLAKYENLPVTVSDAPSTSSSTSGRSAGLGALRMLTQTFRLRLKVLSSETRLRDYSSNEVHIEPLATARAIEEFLWTRVQTNAAAAALAAAATAVSAPSESVVDVDAEDDEDVVGGDHVTDDEEEEVAEEDSSRASLVFRTSRPSARHGASASASAGTSASASARTRNDSEAIDLMLDRTHLVVRFLC